MQDQQLREHIVYLLRGGGAHLDFEKAIANLPVVMRGKRPESIPYSPWQLLEHMRICQWDILEFSTNADHDSPEFPDGYWPDSESPPDGKAWDTSVARFRNDLAAMIRLVSDPSTNLFTPITHGDGQTVLREALLVADHNAYHLGQLVVVRRALGVWPNQ